VHISYFLCSCRFWLKSSCLQARRIPAAQFQPFAISFRPVSAAGLVSLHCRRARRSLRGADETPFKKGHYSFSCSRIQQGYAKPGAGRFILCCYPVCLKRCHFSETASFCLRIYDEPHGFVSFFSSRPLHRALSVSFSRLCQACLCTCQ